MNKNELEKKINESAEELIRKVEQLVEEYRKKNDITIKFK